MSKKSFNVAVDGAGNTLPFTPSQVEDVLQRGIAHGDLIMAVFKVGDDLMVKVFGEPSEEIGRILDMVASSYRKAILKKGVTGS